MSQETTPADIIEFMLDPSSYQHVVETVEHRQTHVSHLFFAGDYVYKIKKRLDLGFLDFSTLEKRREAAVAELEIDRRLAPDVYLDVAVLHRDDHGQLSFSAPTSVEEVAVVMRRLPDEQRLSLLVETGAAQPQMMKDLGRLVAQFHRDAATSPEIETYGSLSTIRHNWDENFEQTEPFIDRTLSRQTWETCCAEIERYMRVYSHIFDERISSGRIRDCHGDMQTDDIFVDPDTGTAHVLDAIEFNRRFRYSDTLSDVAFLSMDLRKRGAPELAEAFLESYYASSSDTPIPSLLLFYECYRAYVRGKVRSFVVDQPEPAAAEKESAASEARGFFELALSDALRLRPRLVLVAGLMGSGKTRQAQGLGELASVRVLSSDVVRKELANLDPEERQEVPFRSGIYSAEWTERTYGALLEEARGKLARGNSAILDASWSKAQQRAAAREVAREREALFFIVECTAPDEILNLRLSSRRRRITDGRIELLDDQRAAYETPTDDEADRVIHVDTDGDFRWVSARLFEALFTESVLQPSP